MIDIVEKMSERYKKTLVTVKMGFREEKDIKKNGLHRFTLKEKKELISFSNFLFNKNKSLLVLKIKETGYRSIHLNIKSEKELDSFINNLEEIYKEFIEIWVVSSSTIECWRCRMYISDNSMNDTFEMAYSYDDHVLDHLNSKVKLPYACFMKENNTYKILNTNLNIKQLTEANLILQDILYKYSNELRKVREDINLLGITGISLDIRVNNGYDFHDFDITYNALQKVLDYYIDY